MKHITPEAVIRATKESGLSIGKLAEKAHVNRSVIERWRSGKTKPTLRTLEKINAALSTAEGETS